MDTFYERNKFKIWTILFLVIVGSISIASLVLVTDSKKTYTESLYSDVLNPATFKHTSAGNQELLYSYSLGSYLFNSGRSNNTGFFTIVMTGPFDIPSITFDVRDQLDRSIISNSPVVGKTTIVKFTPKSDTTTIQLFINPVSPGIQLTNLSITLDR